MKKMRKLIPAFAMLMVAAIMMTTASFAWFTMNESTTVTGMEIKAKAAGNLLISKAPLTAIDQDITVSFSDITKKDLTPITLNTTDDSNKKWEKPTNGKDVDPTYGNYTGAMTTVTPAAIGSIYGQTATDNHFAEFVVYIATAGDAMTADLYLDLAALAGLDQSIAPAYSVAVWVGNNTDVNAPDAHYNFKAFQEKATGVDSLLVKTGVSIPTTFEKNSSNADGLKVVVRLYVDGALKKDQKVEVETNKIVACTGTYGAFKTANAGYANFTFYKNGVEIDDYNWSDDFDLAANGISYWNGTDKNVTERDVYYVNNASIPNASTTFEVEFFAKNAVVGNNG